MAGISEADVAEEQAHFANVIATFQKYAPYAVFSLLFTSYTSIEIFVSFLPTIVVKRIFSVFR
jgi:hypothetical protein